MKLPIDFKDFAKDPVKGMLFIVLVAVGYLYYDNKSSYLNQNKEYKAQLTDCGNKVQKLENKVEDYYSKLRKSDSTLSVVVARLQVLNEINNIK
jgi:uncharacterized protein YlxW (UPF0749 family)